MDFNESPEEAAFRAKIKEWIKENAKFVPADYPPGEFAMFFDYKVTKEQVEMAKQWQRRLYDAGFVGLGVPKKLGGQGGNPGFSSIMYEELQAAGLPIPYNGIGNNNAVMTILYCGNPEQKERYIKSALQGDEMWCQMFSEPAAGSDLASLETTAVRDGDDYIVNGQKVWCSGAHYADWGLMLVRTDPNVPKHAGISYLLLDMHSPGVTVRPLKQMTGGESFNEVFLDEVRVPAKNMLGNEGDGWKIGMTTIAFERGGMGEMGGGEKDPLLDLLRERKINGRPAIEDSLVRQEYARIKITNMVMLYSIFRMKTRASKGQMPGAEVSMYKFMATDNMQREANLAIRVPGIAAAVTSKDSKYAVDGGELGEKNFSSVGLTLAGGTDEIAKNQVGEQVLGLPPEPRMDKGKAFKDLPRGTMAQ